MKTRLNLTIEESLLQRIKSYSRLKQTSISEIVEKYFSQLTEVSSKPSIFEFMKEIEPSSYPKDFDFKKDFFQQLKKDQENE